MLKNFKEAFFIFTTFLILEYSYIHFISPAFGYSGFNLDYSGNYVLNTSIYIIVIVFSVLVSQVKYSDFSKITIFIILSFLIYPSIILYKYSHNNFFIVLINILLFAILYVFLNYVNISIPKKKLNTDSSKYLLFLLTIILFIPFYLSFGLNLNINTIFLNEIYETREDYSYVSNTLLDYTFSVLSKIVAPIGLIISLDKKNYSLSIIFSIIILYMFFISGSKIVLFGYISILFFYYLNKKRRFLFLLIIFNSTLVSTILLAQLFESPLLGSLITRRAFFLPSLLDFYYFDFFYNNPIYYSHSFLSFLFDYPHELPPKNLIAIQYFDNFQMNANNGLISDGYMNLGFTGVVINILVFSIIMTFIKSLKINLKYYGLIFIFIFSIISSPLSTVIITHGGLLLLIILTLSLKNSHEGK